MVSLGGILGGASGGSVSIVISAIDNFSSVFDKSEKELAKLQRSALAIGTALTAVGIAGVMVGKSLATAAADFEMTTIAFTTMLGSAEKAKEFLEELTDFAAKTPFSLKGVEDSAKRLMAVGFAAEDVLPVLKSVGDIASGLGLREEGLQRLILNLGQVQTQGRLTGRELRDFAIAGVPIYEALADQMGVATSAIGDMVSASEISSKDVIAAFEKMTSAGGKFANMMDKMSKTTAGQLNNLKDSIEKLQRELGKELLPVVSMVTETVAGMIEIFDNMDDSTKTLIVSIGVGVTVVALFTGAVILATVAVAAFSVVAAPLIIALGGLSTVLGGLVIAVGVVATSFYGLTTILKGTELELQDFNAAVAGVETNKFAVENLAKAFKLVKTGADEAVDAIINILPKTEEELLISKNMLGMEKELRQAKIDMGSTDKEIADAGAAKAFWLEDRLKIAQEKFRVRFTEKRSIMERMDEVNKELHKLEIARKDEILEKTHQINLDLEKTLMLSDKAAARLAALPTFGAPGTTIMTGGPLPGIPISAERAPVIKNVTLNVKNLFASSPEETAQILQEQIQTIDGGF